VICCRFAIAVGSDQWRSQPKNLVGAKMFDSRQITLFCLEKRLSKHNDCFPLAPLATPMVLTARHGTAAQSVMYLCDSYRWLLRKCLVWLVFTHFGFTT